jgi:hypothetical protein
MDANLKEMKEGVRTNQARIESNHEENMAKLDAHFEGMMACLGKTETSDLEANPEEMQCEAVHREVPKEDAAVETGRTPNKWHRVRYLVAEYHCKPKDGSWRKLAATCRGTTHHAGVARHKGHIVGKNQT